MSATGFVTAILLCGAPGECETTALRAVRYQSLERCQAAIPEALDIAARAGRNRAMLTAQCRSLAELCLARVVSAPALALRPQLPRAERNGRASSTMAAVLAVLCAPPPDQGC